jgi:hypothetical protein
MRDEYWLARVLRENTKRFKLLPRAIREADPNPSEKE